MLDTARHHRSNTAYNLCISGSAVSAPNLAPSTVFTFRKTSWCSARFMHFIEIQNTGPIQRSLNLRGIATLILLLILVCPNLQPTSLHCSATITRRFYGYRTPGSSLIESHRTPGQLAYCSNLLFPFPADSVSSVLQTQVLPQGEAKAQPLLLPAVWGGAPELHWHEVRSAGSQDGAGLHSEEV